METPLQAIERQIQAENDRHKRSMDNINRQKDYENTQHQNIMRNLNNRKEQLKRTVECLLYDKMNKKYATLDKMYETIQKATEDFI